MMKYRHRIMIALVIAGALLWGTAPSQDEDAPLPPINYDPLWKAQQSVGRITNHEATVPSQCYTETAGVANPCWTCHAEGTYPNEWADWDLQEEYAFSDAANTNRWANLFIDRSAEQAAITDAQVLAWVRTNNYDPLRDALATRTDYPGYVPDLDFERGFDREGFARDGSGWRAIRYKPFPGTFWPTNGSTDDVFIRLPEKFRSKNGKPNRAVYKANLSILDASMAGGPKAGRGKDFRYPVEPINEKLIGQDMNGNGKLDLRITEIVGFPKKWVGDAAGEVLEQYLHPEDTEYLHTVRYLDPDAPNMTSKRMKEVRYSKKITYLDRWARSFQFEREWNEKEEGALPIFAGSPMVGLISDLGWQLQGFIEDEQGRLRLQTHEEHQFCMGCHGPIGITADTTFTLPRKVPGSEGWRYQSTTGIPDVPQQGHEKGEIATYFERVGGGDEFRANTEILKRFFADGKMNEAEVARAGVGGDVDMNHLVVPSRERALDLNRAYMVLVKAQLFERGRDTIIGPVENVHRRIENGSTDLADAGKVFKDGVIQLDWSGYKPVETRSKKKESDGP